MQDLSALYSAFEKLDIKRAMEIVRLQRIADNLQGVEAELKIVKAELARTKQELEASNFLLKWTSKPLENAQ